MSKEKGFLLAALVLHICAILFFIWPVVLSGGFKKEECYNAFSEGEDELKMSYPEAKQFVKQINIKTKKEFFKFALSADKPEQLPMNPSKAYKEWKSWEDFLGVKRSEDGKVSKVSSASDIENLMNVEAESD